MQLIVINWIDADGSDCTTRFEREYDAIRLPKAWKRLDCGTIINNQT
jgi:hypothetical protein